MTILMSSHSSESRADERRSHRATVAPSAGAAMLYQQLELASFHDG